MDFQNKPILHTDRLCLHSFQDNDRDDLIAMLTNSEIGKTYMLPVLSSREAELKMFQRFQALSNDPAHFVYGIYRKDRLVGFLNDVEQRGTQIELGYVIHPDHKNQGYATEALAAAMQALFDLGLTAVVTGAFAENTASMRVMEKCGMTLTGTEEVIAYQGVDHRCVYYKKERPV